MQNNPNLLKINPPGDEFVQLNFCSPRPWNHQRLEKSLMRYLRAPLSLRESCWPGRGPHGGVWLPPQRIWEKKKEHLNPQIMDFDGERRTLFRLAYRLYMLIYCTWFVWDSTWNQICGLKLSRPCLSCIHGCYDMSCYYVLFRCICFIQFHPATSDTVVTDDLCSHGLGWSSKILPRCHFVGGFWINITLDLRIMFFFRW